MSVKKIAIVSNSLDVSAGGGLAYVLAIASVLKLNNQDVTLFFKKNIQLEEIKKYYNTEGIKIKTIVKKNIPIISQIIFAIKEYKNFDIVIEQSLMVPRITFVKESYILCDFPRKKKDSLVEKIRLLFWKRVIANSEYTKYWIKNYWDRNSLVLYPPVSNSEKLNEVKILDFICIGRMHKGKRSKRQDVVIEVFKKLFNNGYKEIKLHVVGFVQDVSYLEELKKAAEGYPVYFYNKTSFEEKNRLLSQSSFFISACGYEINEQLEPEFVEHYGISVVEAMMYGCIPLVIGKGGHLETVDHSENGFHWYTREELLVYINRLLENSVLRNELVVQSKSKSEKYSMVRFKENMEVIFKFNFK